MSEFDPTQPPQTPRIDQQGPQISDKDAALNGALLQVEAAKAEYSDRNPRQAVAGLTESGTFVSVLRLNSVNDEVSSEWLVQHGDPLAEEGLQKQEAPGLFARGSGGQIYLSRDDGDFIDFPSIRDKANGAKVSFRGEDIFDLGELDGAIKAAAQERAVQPQEQPERKKTIGTSIGRLLGRRR